MGVTVKIIGADNFAKKQIKFVADLADRQLARMAINTTTIMRKKIKESISRAGSTGNLENSITYEKLGEANYGVGNISFLNQQSPYWRHVNWGSVAIGASHSHKVPTGGFVPGTSKPMRGGSGASWAVGADNYAFTPTKPIAPLNFIAKTLRLIPSIIRKELSRGR